LRQRPSSDSTNADPSPGNAEQDGNFPARIFEHVRRRRDSVRHQISLPTGGPQSISG
jgi:hypothetical protein